MEDDVEMYQEHSQSNNKSLNCEVPKKRDEGIDMKEVDVKEESETSRSTHVPKKRGGNR